MTKSLIEGSVFKNIVRFSLPFLLSYFLQTLYGLADLFIAGQFNGADIITAVSVGSQIMHMVTVIIVGLAMGTTVLIGHAVGAKDSEKVRSLIYTSAAMFAVFAVIFTAVLLLCCPGIVAAVSTPKESVEGTKAYLYICFAGIPFIMAYNVIASVFRGLGDSKSPMIYISIACAVNIVLDYAFMGPLGMGARGAAFATILAQTISVIISLTAAILKQRRASENSQSTSEKKSGNKLINSRNVIDMLKIGVPVACQDGFIQISFLLITVIANRRGVDVAAAVGIVEKIITFLFLVPSSMLSSVSAIASQNLGAGKTDRAERTLFYGMGIGFTFGMIFAVAFQFIAEPVIGCFTSEPQVVTLGAQYIHSYIFDCVFAAIQFCFSGYFCALGKSIFSFIHNVISILAVRIPGAYFASVMFPETLFPMGFAAAAGSFLSSIICLIIFFAIRRTSKK